MLVDPYSLCNSASLDQPGEFHRRDPNREHGSIQYFNDSVVCMEWGYGIYKNHLALGLANGSLCRRSFHGKVTWSFAYVRTESLRRGRFAGKLMIHNLCVASA